MPDERYSPIQWVDVPEIERSAAGFHTLGHLKRIITPRNDGQCDLKDHWFVVYRGEYYYQITVTDTVFTRVNSTDLRTLPRDLTKHNIPYLFVKRLRDQLYAGCEGPFVSMPKIPAPEESLEDRVASFWHVYLLDEFIQRASKFSSSFKEEYLRDAVEKILAETFFTNR